MSKVLTQEEVAALLKGLLEAEGEDLAHAEEKPSPVGVGPAPLRPGRRRSVSLPQPVKDQG